MGSRFLGVPLSATQMSPNLVTSSPGIRAPVTVDDSSDFEYSVSSKSRRNSTSSDDSYYNGSDLDEYEEFGSGGDQDQDELVLTDAESTNLNDQEVQVVEKTDSSKKGYALSRTSSVSKEFLVQESGTSSSGSNSNRRGFLRPSSVRSFRPVVAVKDDDDDEVSDNELMTPPEDVNVFMTKKLNVPIALVSRDSDDESQGSVVLEDDNDDDLSGVVRVPRVELLQRVKSMPKARISEVIGQVESESIIKNDTKVEFVEDLVIDNVVTSSNGEIEKDQIGEEGSISHASSDTMIENGEVTGAESTVDFVFANEVPTSMSETEKNELTVHLDEEIQEIDSRGASMNFSEGILPGDTFSVPSSTEDMEITYEIIELKEPDFSKLEYSGDFGEIVLYEMEPEITKFHTTEDNLESNQNIEHEIVNCENDQNPGYNFLSSDSGNGNVDQGADTTDEVLTHISALSKEILVQSEQGNLLDKETGEIHQIVQFSGVIDASALQELFFSAEDILQDQTQVIDGLIISDSEKKVDTDDGISGPEEAINSFVVSNESKVALSKGDKKKLEKIQQVRIKYLRLLFRLGFSSEDSVASHVLYQLKVAESRFTLRQLFDHNSLEEEAMKLESQNKEDLDFSLTILVIGKSGVGKSATINSIFGETKTAVDAFASATTYVKEFRGMVNGVKIKVFDTPGLRTSTIDQSINQKVLASIKKIVRKCPPDVILYVDRLDTNTSYLNDLHLFKAVTSYLGSPIWAKSIVVLTHASSLPPDGSDGFPITYDALVSKWSRVFQQLISLSSAEVTQKMNPSSMAPVNLVENNHFSLDDNENRESLSHVGESWRSKLLLLCYSIKTLAEVDSIAPIQNSSTSLSFYLSTSPQQPAADPRDENAFSDVELPHLSDFHILRRDQRKTHFNEEFNNVAAPLQDMKIPLSFDGDNPSFRYHFFEPSSDHFLTRPVLESHGWDHDCGYDGVLVEYELDVVNRIFKAETVFRDFKKNQTVTGISFSYPIDQNQTSMGLSLMRYGGEFVYGCNLESKFSLDKDSRKLKILAGLNNKSGGRISVKTSSCLDQIQLAVMALLPIASAIFKNMFARSTENHSKV